jgi:hypothetical protein
VCELRVRSTSGYHSSGPPKPPVMSASRCPARSRSSASAGSSTHRDDPADARGRPGRARVRAPASTSLPVSQLPNPPLKWRLRNCPKVHRDWVLNRGCAGREPCRRAQRRPHVLDGAPLTSCLRASAAAISRNNRSRTALSVRLPTVSCSCAMRVSRVRAREGKHLEIASGNPASAGFVA